MDGEEREQSLQLAGQQAAEIEQLRLRVAQLEERLEAFRQETSAAEEQSLLRVQVELGAALGSASTLDEAFASIGQALRKVQAVDVVGIYLIDALSGALTLVYHQGISDAFVQVTYYYPSDSANARLISTGLPYYLNNGETLPASWQMLQNEGIRVVAVIPILHDGQVIAVLNLGSRSVAEFTPAQCAMFESLAMQIGSVVSRVKAEEQVRYQANLLQNVADAMIFTDLEQHIHSWNSGAEKMFGWSKAEALGKRIDELIQVEYLDATFDEVKASFFEAGLWMGRTRQTRRDGAILYLHTSASQVMDAGGAIIGALAVNRDITELVLAEQARAGSEQRFRTLFERNRAVQLVIDPQTGQLLDGNQAALDFYGYSREVFRRLNIRDLNPLDGEQIDVTLNQALSGEAGTFVFTHRLASGEPRIVEAHPTPIEQEGKTVLYSIIHDITDRIEAEQALRESEGVLRAVLYSSSDLVVLKDLGLVHRFANPAVFRKLGLREDQVIGKTAFESLPERVALLSQEQDRRVIATRREQGGDFSLLLNGERAWFNVVASPMFGEDGEVVGVVNVLRDISERKRIEAALADSEQRYREIIEQQGEGVLITDASGYITFANPMADSLAGVQPGALLGANLDRFFLVELLPQYLRQVEMLSQGMQASMEVALARPDGQKRDLFITSTPRFNDVNEYQGAINIIRDITQIKQSENKLRYDATHDGLTGLYNRTYYEEVLQSFDTKGTYPISILMMDVDGLKAVNDRFGHAFGDTLLRRAAAIIAQSTRGEDLVMRTGGDEFVVFLPGTTIAQVQRVRERIERAILTENESRTHPFSISLSVGCHTSMRPGGLREAVAMADMEMYQVKRQKKRS